MLTIRRLLWDDWNVNHIARHDVRPEKVEEVCQGDFIVLVGKKDRVIVIGPSTTGRMLAVILDLEPKELDVYYPVTARPAARKERRIYRQMKDRGEIT
jgi:uncharacterized protein